MNTTMSVSVAVYGVFLILLSLLVRSVDPEIARLAMMTGTIGGALCVLLGILGWTGYKVRGWTILVLIGICYLLLSQVVISWGSEAALADGVLGAVLLTLKLVASIALVAYLAHAGGAYYTRTPQSDG
jgi:hypothetical protein